MSPAPPNKAHRARRAVALAGVAVAGVALAQMGGCFYTDQGLSPLGETFYFPTGIVVSPGRSALYVANSDFDLQYNGGTVQVLDLVALRKSVSRMLAGIRCSQGDACDEYVSLGGNAEDDLQAVCRGIALNPEGTSSGKKGATCSSQSDCASGNCVFPDGSLTGSCDDCHTSADCVGGGFCISGTCQLDLATNQILTPAACSPILSPFKGYNTIGAFASGAVLAQSFAPGSGARLFVPVRGDPSITWFDIADDRIPGASDPFKLDCGSKAGARCNDEHRLGVDPYDNFRDLTLPVEPTGLDVSFPESAANNQNALVSAHQISNAPAVGLAVNHWTPGPKPAEFDYYLGGISAGPTEVAAIPTPAVVKASQTTSAPMLDQPGFLVTYNATPEVDVVRVDFDALSNPPRPFLQVSSKTPVTINANGADSRGVAVDATKRKACEAACDPADLVCLGNCVTTPVDVFIANRTPPTLLLGQIQTTLVPSPTGGPGGAVYDLLDIYSSVAVSVGVSRVLVGNVLGTDGLLHSRVFVVCFDTRTIYAYDPAAPGNLPEVIHTGRGPHAIAFDACCDGTKAGCQPTDACSGADQPHAYLYVGHFTDSYLGVVDLDLNHPSTTFGTMFASIGVPLAPPETM